jgi:hypothetical protein
MVNMFLVQALYMFHEGGYVCRCVNLFIVCRQHCINLNFYPKANNWTLPWVRGLFIVHLTIFAQFLKRQNTERHLDTES